MAKIICTHADNGITMLRHAKNGSVIETDLPKQVGGEGRLFCPGDLFAGSVAACLLATMGEMAKHRGKSLGTTNITVGAEFSGKPEHVTRLTLKVEFDASIDEVDRKKYLAALNACPVRNSIDKDIEVVVTT